MNIVANKIEELTNRMNGNIGPRSRYYAQVFRDKKAGVVTTGKVPTVETIEVVESEGTIVVITGSYAERRGSEFVKLSFKLNGKRAKKEEVLNLF